MERVDNRQTTRGHIFHDLTRSLCPQCRQVIDAQVLIRDNKVYLRKRCPEHGWSEAIISSDAQWYLKSFKYNKPGAIPFAFTTKVREGCPYDCGLCPEHQQHTCLALIEITTRCNLHCPTCFADSGSGYDLSLVQVEKMLDRLVETEREPEIVQFSGGEPTIHPQILDMMGMAKKHKIRHIMLNTNGIRLALEPHFVRQLSYYEPTVYLQFDGLSAETYLTLRGGDIREVKSKALDNLAEAGIYAILVATIAQGVNEKEVGNILHYGLEHPAVLGVCFQPVTFAGRSNGHPDPLQRITVPDVLYLLEAQTDSLFKVSDFLPVPCPQPDCSACTYALVDKDKVIPLTRLLNVDDYLDFLVNHTAVDLSEELRPVLESLWSMATVMGGDKTTQSLTCATCGINLKGLDLKNLRERFFMVQVHGFMDEYNFDLKRLMKCCVHQLLPDGKAVPFCAYNNLGYRQRVRQQQESIIKRK